MHKVLIVHRDNRDSLNTWLDHHPLLDVQGGGGDTFKVQYHVIGGGPNDVHYVAGWKMPQLWIDTLIAELEQRQWNINVNTTSPPPKAWDFAWYEDDWTLDEILADVTRKPYALEGPIQEPDP